MPQKKTHRLTLKLLRGIRIEDDLYNLVTAARDKGWPDTCVLCCVDGMIGLECRDQQRRPHRDDGPARLMLDGTETWFRHGEIHREDGPAIIYPDGEEHWYQNDKLHREGAPAIVSPDGAESWFVKGDLHRLDGPAITSAGGTSTQYWRRGYVVCKWVIDKEIREQKKEQLIVDLKARVKELEKE